MKGWFVFFISFLFVGHFFHSCSTKDDFTPQVKVLTEFRSEYERIVRMLAHDSLHGRWIPYNGINKTEQIIKREFQRIGLEAPSEYPDFLQPFEVITLVPSIDDVSLNQKPLHDTEIIIMPRATSDHIDLSHGKIDIVHFGAQGNFAEQQKRHVDNVSYGTSLDQLVVVPRVFENEFNDLKTFIEEGSIFGRHAYTGNFTVSYGNVNNNIIYVLSDEPIVSSFTLTYTLMPLTLNNIIGTLPGKSRPDEIVIFCSHVDHLGTSSLDDDPIFNGANDNASGVAAMIILAEYFSRQKNNERTLVFIGFNGEERGLLGSKHFVSNPTKGQIKCVINIDMIGNETPYGRSQAFLSGSDRSNLLEILNENLANTGYKIHQQPAGAETYDRSDHKSFVEAHILAHNVTTFMGNYPNYHQPTDDVEGINFDDTIFIVEAIAQSVSTIVAGKDLD